jgi:hypothetical protein
MRKPFAAIGVCALVVGLTAAPSAVGKKPKPKPKQIPTLVSVFVTPCCTVTPATTSVAASGEVGSSGRCRKSRTVRFDYQNGATVTRLAVTATTDPNGHYSAVLPRPTDPPPATVTLHAIVDRAFRKKKGKRFICLETRNGQTLTVSS